MFLLDQFEVDSVADVNYYLSRFRHLVSTLKIGTGGVVHNYGIPRLTQLELQLIERAVLLLNERERMALKALQEAEEATSSKSKSMKFNC